MVNGRSHRSCMTHCTAAPCGAPAQMQAPKCAQVNVYPAMRAKMQNVAWSLHCCWWFLSDPRNCWGYVPLRIQKMANPDSELGVPDQSFWKLQRDQEKCDSTSVSKSAFSNHRSEACLDDRFSLHSLPALEALNDTKIYAISCTFWPLIALTL